MPDTENEAVEISANEALVLAAESVNNSDIKMFLDDLFSEIRICAILGRRSMCPASYLLSINRDKYPSDTEEIIIQKYLLRRGFWFVGEFLHW